jgi:hypothetical protein
MPDLPADKTAVSREGCSAHQRGMETCSSTPTEMNVTDAAVKKNALAVPSAESCGTQRELALWLSVKP